MTGALDWDELPFHSQVTQNRVKVEWQNPTSSTLVRWAVFSDDYERDRTAGGAGIGCSGRKVVQRTSP